MKPGMKVIKSVEGNNRWVWLCEESLTGQGCREWATYVSASPNDTQTENGHYFVNYSNAEADFNSRVQVYS